MSKSSPTCPTCHSDDPKKFYAWSTAFGGRWIPWYECKDSWHKDEKPAEEGL